jgi:hypothetical protein
MLRGCFIWSRGISSQVTLVERCDAFYLFITYFCGRFTGEILWQRLAKCIIWAIV